MNINNAMRVSGSGLSAERFRMDVIAGNIANANSTFDGVNQPYRRREVVLSGSPLGVQITDVLEDESPFSQKYEPGNKYADKSTGMVMSSNVKPLEEMVNMMSASRAYEANVAAFNSTKSMIRSALSIGKI